jgi:hypothetical protein
MHSAVTGFGRRKSVTARPRSQRMTTDREVLATLLFEFNQSDTVNVVAMEGNRLAAGGANRQVVVHDIACGLLLHTFNLKETVNTISMREDLLAAGTPQPRSVRLYATAPQCPAPLAGSIARAMLRSGLRKSAAGVTGFIPARTCVACGRRRGRRSEDLCLQPECWR